MMEIKQLETEYTYELDLDIVNIKVKKKEYTYRESIDFDAGVFQDFDENDFAHIQYKIFITFALHHNFRQCKYKN